VTSPRAPDNGRWPLDRLLLLALAGVAGAVGLATPALIKPFPEKAAWYESAAMFPRVALALVVAGALAELWRRRRASAAAGSDELDARLASGPLALGMLLLFVAYALAVPWLGFMVSTALYLAACGALLRLPWRLTLGIAVMMALGLWLVFARLLKVAFGHGLLF
jgi:hypothetical protein